MAACAVGLIAWLAGCADNTQGSFATPTTVPVDPSGTPQTTALAATATGPARYVPANDGKIHVEYDLVFTNSFTAPITLTSLVVSAGDVELERLDGDALKAITFKLLTVDPTLEIPASAAVFAVVDLVLQSTAVSDMPAALTNTITYQTPDDAPLRTILGSNTVTMPPLEIDRRAPVVIQPPLRGDGWLDANGCCVPNTAHRSVLLPANGIYKTFEMFAIDWFRWVDGNVLAGDDSQLESYHAYGQTIHSVADGEVVYVRNDQPQAPINMSSAGNPTVKEASDYAGNSVVVRIAPDRYAAYAHLQTGSARPKVGDRIKAGDVIGLLGNSGNSTIPHLHFAVLDSPSALTANSVPFVFDRYAVTALTAPAPDGSLSVQTVSSPQEDTFPLVDTIIDMGGDE